VVQVVALGAPEIAMVRQCWMRRGKGGGGCGEAGKSRTLFFALGVVNAMFVGS
jgi:hypothetical protein